MYGNRVPGSYRAMVIGGAVIIVVLNTAMVSLSPSLGLRAVVAVLLTLVLIFSAAYCLAGTFVLVRSNTVVVGLAPFIFHRFSTSQIQSVRTSTVFPIMHWQWGWRGNLASPDGLLLDAGFSRDCVEFVLHDGRIIRLGVDSPARGAQIVSACG